MFTSLRRDDRREDSGMVLVAEASLDEEDPDDFFPCHTILKKYLLREQNEWFTDIVAAIGSNDPHPNRICSGHQR